MLEDPAPSGSLRSAGLAGSDCDGHALQVSDANLRALERRFRETGSVEDEAAWLRARIQAGELKRTRLELAAYCGHEAACLTAELGGASLPSLSTSVLWCKSLPDTSAEVLGRCSVAGAFRSLEMWQRYFPRDSRPHEAVCVAESLLCGKAIDEEADFSAAMAAESAAMAAHETGDDILPEVHYEAVQDAAYAASAAVLVILAERAPLDALSKAALALDYALDVVGVSVLAEAIQEELAPWALGYGDPVRERVVARQRTESSR